jgi:hypothetical protein
MNFLTHIITGKDNTTFDLVRVLGLLGCLQALALVAYGVVYKGQPFDLQNFGIGFGALLGSVGAALKLKETTEPEVK